MAKIKFNLNFGGEQIRTLDDLRENFSIEDILDVFNNGMLVKWLDVHNHKAELAKVKAIQATDARSILSELIHIFGVTSDESEIQESLSVLDYLEGRKRFWADIKAGKFDEIARNLTKAQNEKEAHHDYDTLVQNIIDHPEDLHYIYDQLDAIVANYPEMLKANALELYKRLYSIAPLAVMALFGNSATRPYFDERNLKNGAVAALLGCKSFSTSFYDDYIRGFNRYNKIQIPNNVKKRNGTNGSSWYTIEPAGKKFLLLACYRHLSNTVFFSNADDKTRRISSVATPFVTPVLPIVNGIAAEEFGIFDTLWYMEAR